MNRTVILLVAVIACAAQPLAAAGQVSCSDLEMVLVVRVEASGQTEAEASANLEREVSVVAEKIDTPCITQEEPATGRYTDGVWGVVAELTVSGSEEYLRDIAASLDGAATPVRLDGDIWGLVSGAVLAGMAAGAVVSAGVVAYVKIKHPQIRYAFATMMLGGMTFANASSIGFLWIQSSRLF